MVEVTIPALELIVTSMVEVTILVPELIVTPMVEITIPVPKRILIITPIKAVTNYPSP